MSKQESQRDDNSKRTDLRALGEATTVVLLIIVAVAATGTISFAIQGFTDGLQPSAGGNVNFQQEGGNLTVTVTEVDPEVSYIEFRGETSFAETDVTVNGGDGSVALSPGGDVRIHANRDNVTAGDVIKISNPSGDLVSEGETITVVTLDGEGNENTIREYEVGPTGAS